MKTIISPSILACDFSQLGSECENVLSLGADWLHVDVMDGHFVPNLSLGPPIIASLRRRLPHAYLDVHLMITEPHKWVDMYLDAGASGITFHYEAMNGDPVAIRALLTRLREMKVTVGMVIKPQTAVEVLFPFLDEGMVDLVLIMTVEPGFGGQKFMPDQMEKVRKLRARYPQLLVEVDGGLNGQTSRVAAEAGANVIVAGSAIFGATDRSVAIADIRKALTDFS